MHIKIFHLLWLFTRNQFLKFKCVSCVYWDIKIIPVILHFLVKLYIVIVVTVHFKRGSIHVNIENTESFNSPCCLSPSVIAVVIHPSISSSIHVFLNLLILFTY